MMKLRLGGFYRDCEGRVIGPLISNTAESAKQGFVFKHLHRSYTANGGYRVHNGKRWWPDRFDLVEEFFVPNRCCKTLSEAWSCEGCCPDKPAYEAAWKKAYPEYSEESLRIEIARELAKRGFANYVSEAQK